MKKLLVLMLAATLALSLAACGGGSGAGDNSTGNGDTTSNDTSSGGGEDSTQLDAENATAETPKHIYKDVEENQARAMQNTYLMNCRVGTITDTYFTTDYGIQVHLPIEQLAQLNNSDNIAIIGQITDVNNETDGDGRSETAIIFGIAEVYDGIVPDVEPREDEKFVGVLSGEGTGTWNIKIGSSTRPIYFAEGEDTSTLKNGDAIIFTADAMGFADNPDNYRNAKVIEIMGLEELDKYLAGIS